MVRLIRAVRGDHVMTATIPVRIEKDSLGAVEVPADRLWGTDATLPAFFSHRVSRCQMRPVIRAFGIVKSAALANGELNERQRKRCG